jgi:hypothetical protein
MTTHGLHVLMDWETDENLNAIPVGIKYTDYDNSEIDFNQFVICGEQKPNQSIIDQIRSVYRQVETYGGLAAVNKLIKLAEEYNV